MRKRTKTIRAICILLPIIGFVVFIGDWIIYAVSVKVKEAYTVDLVYESGWFALLIKGMRTTITWILVFVTIRLMLRDYMKNGNLLNKKRIENRSKVKDYTCIALSVINIILIILQWILMRNDLYIDDEELAVTAMFKDYLRCLYYFALYDVITLILVIGFFKSLKKNLSQLGKRRKLRSNI